MTDHSRLIAATLAVALLGACSPQSTNGASANTASNQTLSAVSAPSAGGGEGGGGLRQACAADFQQYCPDFVWGVPGGLGKCMRGRFKEFSQPCQTALVAARNHWQGAKPGQPQSAAPATQ